MASQLMGDACVSLGEFTDSQGNVKKRYQRIGPWFQGDQGNISVKIELVPLVLDPKGGFWVSLFHKQENQNGQGGGQGRPAQAPSRAPAPARAPQQGNIPGGGYDGGEVPF